MMRAERMSGHFTKVHIDGARVLHVFTGADGPDSPFHDHPFGADIEILLGGYVEEVLNPEMGLVKIERNQGDRFRNEADTIHRIIRLHEPLVLTCFSPGPTERKTGFYEMRGNEIWHRFHDSPDWHRW